ncbi:hypothetical protein DM860_016050 [Cuscuta australis]|uniref:Ubiquitin-like domain-containing protein n=1 Tax=Cuscuta australis TaxID=267555 RepID=A0A328E6V4_9ASTE|nr:hypothetical protein DM860_016050 [Cuscuta australis]
MMRMKTRPAAVPQPEMSSGGSRVAGRSGNSDWEMRPCGMLVQKRNTDSDDRPAPPTIRVRVKYGSVYHEINISSQATFGELKKMLTGATGLHHQDQQLLFKDKKMDSKAFLDISGVKNKSKILLVEDPISQEKRYIEMRKNAKMEKAAKTVSEISLEVDRLGGQVSGLESVISRGGRVEEKAIITLIELLMNQLLKLDGVLAEGDVKLQRKMQVRRVQKYVETLDKLKIKNSMRASSSASSSSSNSNGEEDGSSTPLQAAAASSSGNHKQPIVITTKWETFDHAPSRQETPAHRAGPAYSLI